MGRRKAAPQQPALPGLPAVVNIYSAPPPRPRAPARKGKALALPAPPFKVTAEVAARFRSKTKGMDDAKLLAMFKPAVPPPGVVPKGAPVLAMDSSFDATAIWAASALSGQAFSQGYTFLGYPYLAELAQVAEYRLISDVISQESTRKWIQIKSKSDEAAKKEDPGAEPKKADEIRELEEEFTRLNVKGAFEAMSWMDSTFGRAHLYIDTGDTDHRDELMTPIGNGDRFTARKFKKGFFKALKTVEPVWTYPMAYNAQDPLADDWYKPEIWYVMSKGVHISRLLPFIGKPVPDLLKPSFSFGGLSLIQMAKPYVDNWLQTRQSVNDIIQAFSVMVLETDLSTILQDGGESLNARLDLFNNLRDNRGVFAINKATEDFANVSAPLGSLDKLQAQAQEHICSVSRIPLIKYTGVSPSGLNATSDQELEAFDDTIHGYQERFFGKHLTTIFKMAQLSLWGRIDPDLLYEFAPLSEMTEQEAAELQKVKSETHKNYVDMGATAPEEVRQALTEDQDSPYTNLDPADVPEPVLESEHVRETEEVGGGGGGGGE